MAQLAAIPTPRTDNVGFFLKCGMHFMGYTELFGGWNVHPSDIGFADKFDSFGDAFRALSTIEGQPCNAHLNLNVFHVDAQGVETQWTK